MCPYVSNPFQVLGVSNPDASLPESPIPPMPSVAKPATLAPAQPTPALTSTAEKGTAMTADDALSSPGTPIPPTAIPETTAKRHEGFFGHIGSFFKKTEPIAKDVLEVALPVAGMVFPVAKIPTTIIGAVLQLDRKAEIPLPEGETMNTLEQFGITILLAVLQSVVKNPAHAAELKGQLVGVANDIYTAYGMVPPAVA